jgi:hypothetical protein
LNSTTIHSEIFVRKKIEEKIIILGPVERAQQDVRFSEKIETNLKIDLEQLYKAQILVSFKKV